MNKYWFIDNKTKEYRNIKYYKSLYKMKKVVEKKKNISLTYIQENTIFNIIRNDNDRISTKIKVVYI